MKNVILKLFCLGLPFIIFFILVEVSIRKNSVFEIKKSFLEKNRNTVQVLILGSSHHQNAFNPHFLNQPSANIAYGAQPISIDYYLLEKYITKLPLLKRVFIEISPHSFYNDLSSNNWNGHLYVVEYGIKYKNEAFSLKNYSLVLSDIRYFTSAFFDQLNPYSFKYKTNQFGFVVDHFKGSFQEVKYDTVAIRKAFVMEHNFKNESLFKLNSDFILAAIKLCAHHQIQAILITPPFYKTYNKQVPEKVKKRVRQFVNEATSLTGALYYDYSGDKRFEAADFKNDDHLNPAGAKKFSQIINKEVLFR